MTPVSAAGSYFRGKATSNLKKNEAKLLEQQANASLAAGTRVAHNKGVQRDLLHSKARAAMVAGGGSATDPQALMMLSKLQEVGDYNVLSSIYEAKTKFDTLNYQANLRRYEARMARFAGYTEGAQTILSSVASGLSSGSGSW